MSLSTQRFDADEVVKHVRALQNAIENVYNAANRTADMVKDVREQTIGRNQAIEALDNVLSTTVPKLKSLPESVAELHRDLVAWDHELDDAQDKSVLGL